MKRYLMFSALAALLVMTALSGCGGGALAPAALPADEATRDVSLPGKGFQLVLLPYWSRASVTNFLSVTTNSRSPRIEFSFLPFAPRSTDPNPPSNFVNARRMVEELCSAGKPPTVTVYLSFHATAGSSFDTMIGNNAKNLNDNFLRAYADKAIINISPSLEDYGTDADFTRWATLIASKIDSALLGKVAIRRCGLNSHGNTARERYRGVQNEYHGAITTKGTSYSNDGNFVYYGAGRETAASLLGSNPAPQYNLADFQSGTAARSGVCLWRPAYNLLWRDDRRTPVVFDPTRRDWSDPQTAFGSTEIAVAKKFLGIP